MGGLVVEVEDIAAQLLAEVSAADQVEARFISHGL